jgi:hypothetical protein
MPTDTFDFRFVAPFFAAGVPLGITPWTTGVELAYGELAVRFGPWRVQTQLSNVRSAEPSGPYRYAKTVGPAHLSFVDHGLTFATNRDLGLCIRFGEPVTGIEPFGRIRHPALTVTVADVQGLQAALAAA